METQSPPPQEPSLDYYHSNVDTSRPFRSVKEAVAIFGERILVGEIYSCTPNNQIITSSWPPPPDDNNNEVVEEANDDHNEKETETASAVVVLDTLKRLELELKDTKVELKLLKDREQETEVALASLNAQLHKNMSRLAQAEAAAANAQLVVATTRSTTTPTSSSSAPPPPPPPTTTSSALINVAKDQQNKELQEDMAMIRRRKELMKSMQKNTSLAQILSLENDAFFANSNKKRNQIQNQFTKKKPIVPLVGDLFFFRKKNTSSFSSNPQLLYASSQFYHL